MTPAREAKGNGAGGDLLTDLLRSVSRSFYLTLRALPGSVRSQIGLAYLLARASDTIADTRIVPTSERLRALDQFRQRALGLNRSPLDFREMTDSQASSGERILLERAEEACALLGELNHADRVAVRDVLRTIISGQELDLRRFGSGDGGRIEALENLADLEDYTYRVAGCVGEFWTRICRRHVFPRAKLDEALLVRRGIRFGQGLQLVNVLRDLPADLRSGRCYVPSASLESAGLAPAELRDPANEERFRPLYNDLVDDAARRLGDGWAYTNSLPLRCVRVRLACAWPLLIGMQTLGRLRNAPILGTARPIKIDRREVRRLIARSVVSYPFRPAWNALFSNVGRL